MLCQYGEHWLTGSIYGSRARGGARNVRVNDKQVVQVAEFLRAAQISAFGRGNVASRVSFESAWTFDTEAEAGAVCMGFRGTMPGNAHGKFTFGYSAGARVMQLDDAALEECGPVEFKGRTVIMGFALVGGLIYEAGDAAMPGFRIWNPDLSAWCVLNSLGTGERTMQVLSPSGDLTGRAGGALVFNPDLGDNCLVVARGTEPEFILEVVADTTGALPNVPQVFNPHVFKHDSLLVAGTDPFTVYTVANV